MKVRIINRVAYESTINELERIIQVLAKHQNKHKEILQAAEDLQNLQYCIMNTSFDDSINSVQ